MTSAALQGAGKCLGPGRSFSTAGPIPGRLTAAARVSCDTRYPFRYVRDSDPLPAPAIGAALPDIRAPSLGRQFLTGGSGCDCGQLGAGLDERT